MRCLAFVSMIFLIAQAVVSWGQEPAINSDGQVTANQGEQFYLTQVKPILEAIASSAMLMTQRNYVALSR